jgi:hypothetical protein
MKVVSIGNGLVLKETGRMVDRVRNTIQVQLAIEPIYGQPYTADVAAKELRDDIFVSQVSNPLRWNQMKDTSQQEMVEFIHDFLSGYYMVWRAYKVWQENPEYDEEPNPIPNGDPIRTLMPFPQQDAIDALLAENIVDRSFRLFSLLDSRGVTAVELVEV